MATDRIQFVGHSCLWVTLDDRHFLVDTNFSPRLLGILKRHAPPGIDLNNLPDVSALLVTHAHYDHLDIFSYKYFPQDKKIILPKGIGNFVKRFIHNPIVELKEWEEWEAGDPPGAEQPVRRSQGFGGDPRRSIKITAVPARHFGFRFSGLRYTKCLGFVLEGSRHTVYLAGDTAYGPHFREIGERFKIDIACLPIGAYRPVWFMKNRHMNPEEALRAFEDLKAKKMIPIHWGSFRVAWDKVNEPIEWLRRALAGHPAESNAVILQPGESLPL